MMSVHWFIQTTSLIVFFFLCSLIKKNIYMISILYPFQPMSQIISIFLITLKHSSLSFKVLLLWTLLIELQGEIHWKGIKPCMVGFVARQCTHPLGMFLNPNCLFKHQSCLHVLKELEVCHVTSYIYSNNHCCLKALFYLHSNSKHKKICPVIAITAVLIKIIE